MSPCLAKLPDESKGAKSSMLKARELEARGLKGESSRLKADR